jgi:NUDIX domain.
MPDDITWERTGTELEYSCPGFGVRRDDARLPDGSAASYHYVDEPPAVVIVPFTPDGKVVVIEEWRQAIDRVNRGVPAGTIEPTDSGPEPWERESVTYESVETAARRELTEETGYEAGTVDSLVTIEPANGVTNAVHHYVLAHDCRPTGDRALDDDESIRVTPVPYETFREAVRAGEIRDGRAVTAVSYYELHGE